MSTHHHALGSVRTRDRDTGTSRCSDPASLAFTVRHEPVVTTG